MNLKQLNEIARVQLFEIASKMHERGKCSRQELDEYREMLKQLEFGSVKEWIDFKDTVLKALTEGLEEIARDRHTSAAEGTGTR